MALLRRRKALLALMRMICSVQEILPRRFSGTSSSCRRAALALVLATPSLLADTPPGHPVGVSCSTVIWLGCCRATYLARAAPAMHFAAPSFLANRPTHLPIGVPISTVVRVCRPGWSYWHDRHDRSHWHHRLSGTALVVDTAAPRLLTSTPLFHCIHCAVVGIPSRCWACWAWNRPRPRPWRWRWSCWWRCGGCCGCRHWEGCG